MGRTGRRDDPSYWLANRRRFHDDLDKLCRSVHDFLLYHENERQDMVDTYWLVGKLKGMSGDGSKVAVAEVRPDGTILLHITRPYCTGYTEVIIKVVDDAK